MAAITNLRKWKNGEIFNARDYVYERDLIVQQVNRLTALIEGDGEGVDLTVKSITTNSITMDGVTVTTLGARTFLQDTQPEVFLNGDLWFDTSQYGGGE